MFIKAILCDKKNTPIVLNTNRIISMNSLKDEYVHVYADLGSTNRFEECLIKLKDLINVIIEEPSKTQIMEWLKEQGYDESPNTSEPEPNTLSEICEVSFAFNRLVLTVNKGKIEASKKFGLLDNYERYEFDGDSMYFYCPGSTSADFTISCGNGVCTSVSAAIQRCRKNIKTEMAKQCKEKKIAIPNNIALDLSRNTNSSVNNFWILTY